MEMFFLVLENIIVRIEKRIIVVSKTGSNPINSMGMGCLLSFN